MSSAGTQGGRQVQFELLRIVAMLGVVMNHVFNYGLRIYGDYHAEVSDASGGAVWTVLQMFKLLALPSVNCYVLITGYFLFDRLSLRTRGLWKVWITTWLYAVGIYLFCAVTGLVTFDATELLRHATPILSNDYWFVTSYVVLLLLAPFISRVMMRATQRQYLWALLAGGVVCFQPLLGWFLMDEQQILLFVYLYMIGGYIHRFADELLPLRRAAVCFLAVLAVMFAYTLYKNLRDGDNSFDVFAMAYHGLVLPQSVALFCVAKGLRIQSERLKRVVFSLAPLSFAVYVIHTQPLVHRWLWDESFRFLSCRPPLLLPLDCIAITLAVFFVCIVIEGIRQNVSRLLGQFSSKLIRRP